MGSIRFIESKQPFSFWGMLFLVVCLVLQYCVVMVETAAEKPPPIDRSGNFSLSSQGPHRTFNIISKERQAFTERDVEHFYRNIEIGCENNCLRLDMLRATAPDCHAA